MIRLISDWLDIENPRPKKLYTGMGCLSLIAMPIEGAVIGEFIGQTVGWNVIFSGVFSVLIAVGTPLLALFLVRCADRRRELGQVWRELTTAVSLTWLVVAGIGLVVRLLDYMETGSF